MNVLVVDDDHLVRRGIMSMMPWGEFGLQVAGEAENGKRALQLMEERQVDLLLTDIAMPVMNGLELIRETRIRFPQIHIVVLTFHQDFDYIQEAMRLGALDYIAKVELEHESMSDVLSRVIARIRRSEGTTTAAQPEADATRDAALLFVPLAPSADAEQRIEAFACAAPHAPLRELTKDVWVLTDLTACESERIAAAAIEDGGWAVCRVAGVDASKRKHLYKLLGRYMELDFFYDYAPGRTLYDVRIDALEKERTPLTERELYRLKERWSSLTFAYDRRLFDGLIDELGTIRPSITKLESMFFWTLIQWESYTSIKLSPYFETARLRFWTDWVAWLENIRARIRESFKDARYSDEVVAGIMRAADYITQNLSIDLKLTEVAEEVHISRSYFSECFKNIMGKTFHEFVRDARIDYSKALLGQTNEPIYKIAERCGYPDERYFSKVFRRSVGVLPSEIRKRSQGGKTY